MENNNTTKGKTTRQSRKTNSKKTKSAVTPVVINLHSDDIQREIILAKEKLGKELSFDERVYLWSSMLKQYGITIAVGKSTKQIKPSWLKQLTRWIKSLVNKL